MEYPAVGLVALQVLLLLAVALVVHRLIFKARQPLLDRVGAISQGPVGALAVLMDVLVWLLYIAFVALVVDVDSIIGSQRPQIQHVINSLSSFALYAVVVNGIAFWIVIRLGYALDAWPQDEPHTAGVPS